MKKILICIVTFLLLLTNFLVACNNQPESVNGNSSNSSNANSSYQSANSGNGNSSNSSSNTEIEIPEESKYLTNYTPEYFNKNVTYSEEGICDGLVLVKNTVVKSNGQTSFVYALEIDLEKVAIHAGTANNVNDPTQTLTKATPYDQGQAWQEATGGVVYASINADFFGNIPVNAFVKEGIIMKASHNDNGNYDYKNTSSDVPASAPMLFGVSGNKAQVAPIISYTGDITTSAVKQTLIQAQLGYGLRIPSSTGIMSVLENVKADASVLAYHTDRTERTMRSGVVVEVDITKGQSEMEVLSVKTITSATKIKPTYGKTAYFEADGSNSQAVEFLSKVAVGDKLALTVASPDGKWNGYDTVLGCRQALVINGEVASTVTLENTNGAQSKDIPRSAVGVMADGKVVIFAVESLYYGSKASSTDGHGMSLPELAEFMYFYGVENGANFDGGGSTQLVVNRNGTHTAVVRSSDTGSDNPSSSRAVINSVLVTSK